MAQHTKKSADSARDHTSALGSLLGNFGQVISNVVKYNLAQIGLNETIQKTVGVMKELDSQLTNIRMVTGQSEVSAREMLNTYADMAKELGSTTTQVAEGSIEWLLIGSFKTLLTAGNSLEF